MENLDWILILILNRIYLYTKSIELDSSLRRAFKWHLLVRLARDTPIHMGALFLLTRLALALSISCSRCFCAAQLFLCLCFQCQYNEFSLIHCFVVLLLSFARLHTSSAAVHTHRVAVVCVYMCVVLHTMRSSVYDSSIQYHLCSHSRRVNRSERTHIRTVNANAIFFINLKCSRNFVFVPKKIIK